MESIGSREWVQRIRETARTNRSVARARQEKTDTPPEAFPAPPAHQSGLRGLHQTQEEDQLESKGIIINRYL